MSVLETYFVTLLVIAIAFKVFPDLQQFYIRISNYVSSSKAGLQSYDNELYKFSILRILLGTILIYKNYSIFLYGFSSVALFIETLLALFLIFGFLVQYVFIIEIFVMFHMGFPSLGIDTLGYDVAAILIVMLFFTNSGLYNSIDSVLVNKTRLNPKLFLYFSFNNIEQNISMVKFTALVSYGFLGIYSVIYHLNDPAWTEGWVIPQLLSSTYLSRYPEFFQEVLNVDLFYNFAVFSMFLMILWEFFLSFYTLFNKFIQRYMVFHGILFFSVSILVMQLGMLGYYEFLLWIGIFYKKGFRDKLEVYFDDSCNLCDRTIKFISIVDLGNKVKFYPISENEKRLEGISVSKVEAERDLIAYSENKVYKGYHFYLLLTRKILVLLPLFPIIYFGKITQIGESIYKYIAKNRIRIFGVCKIPSKKTVRNTISEKNLLPANFRKIVQIHIFISILFFTFRFEIPKITGFLPRGALTEVSHLYGVTNINVFNEEDLNMEYVYFTIQDLDKNTLIPFTANDGSRLEMHKSDYIYFKNSLFPRRIMFKDLGKCWYSEFEEEVNSVIQSYKNAYKVESNNFKYQQFFKVPNPDQRYLIDKVEMLCEKKINF